MSTSGRRRLYIDEAVGETRAVLCVDDHPRRIAIERWSEAGQRARVGEVYVGRVRRVEVGLGGAFVDLGRGPDGFLPFRRGRRPTDMSEGAAVNVAVRVEAQREKGPVLQRLPGAAPAGSAPRLETPALRPWETPALAGDEPPTMGGEAREMADQAVAEALSPEATIPGGGSLCIEPTRALIAIDVDAGARPATGGPEQMALAVNLAAAGEVAHQLRLRALAGLVAIDFVHMRERAHREQVQAALTSAFAGEERSVDIAPLSRFCVGELSLERSVRPLHDALCAADGGPSVETCALAALRALEREGAADRGAHLTLIVAPEVAAWLEADHIKWRSLLTDRLGARFAVEAVAGRGREMCDVRTL